MGQAVGCLPMKREFCFCMTLKTGSYVAAFLGLVHPVMFVSFSFTGAHTSVQPWVQLAGKLFAVLMFLFSIILLIGVIVGNSCMLMAWVWYSIVFLILIPISMSVLTVKAVMISNYWAILEFFGLVILYIFLYFLLKTVNSHAIDLIADGK